VFLAVTTTLDDPDAARALARGVVEARLAACAQVTPIHSVYRWRGAVEEADEWAVVCKTTAERFDELAAHIRAQHAYEVPEIVATEIVNGDPAYLDWVAAETTRAG
jgi:periplasmic divalent cation tolerance protein